MSRRDNRFDADGNYLLPSEREDRETFGADDGNDDTDLAQQIKDAYPTADDLVHKSMLRAQKHANISAAAPFVTTNPVSILSGTIGGQQLVSTGIAAGGIVPKGVAVQTANWVGDDSETHPLTVTLAPVQQVNAAPGALTGIFGVRPYAVIQWGTRGMMVSAEVDIGLGCQLTVSGSSITVQVGLDGGGTPGGIVDGAQASMILAGMVSAFYPIFRTTPITRTVYLDPFTGIDITNVPVPNFAKNVSFWRNNASTVTATLWFFDSNGETRYTYDLPASTGDGSTGYMFNTIPLDGSITTVGVQKTDGAETLASLIFELTL